MSYGGFWLSYCLLIGEHYGASFQEFLMQGVNLVDEVAITVR